MTAMEILSACMEILKDKAPACLVAVISHTGSVPGDEKALMLVKGDGKTQGSVGGGALEMEAMAQARQAMEEGKARHMEARLTPEMAGMPCGGSASLLLLPLKKGAGPELFLLENLVKDLGERRATGFQVSFSHERKEEVEKRSKAFPCRIRILEETRFSMEENTPPSSLSFFIRLEPQASLLIFGAGHIAQALCPMALAAGFDPGIFDDRKDYLEGISFPENVPVHSIESFEGCMEGLSITPSTWILIATYGHSHDHVVLEQALNTQARYIGMVGSRRKREALFTKLREKGLGDEALARVHCPVGLAIGAQTPGEIAVSILGEMIAIRRKGSL
ncbi:XdhC family protein [Desulfobotulus mexicanus]|uniref:XdhC family protein n=1 Tax=Desulfobotulus mexicanus TaxID=2586642 RepID=A0A5S5MDS2_9BACT|nr:XdhC/CoxI family protein [Desulfobotulus mexicanus]TYT73886.1 XdhC family protein [Desulfobotulus mexicanus]